MMCYFFKDVKIYSMVLIVFRDVVFIVFKIYVIILLDIVYMVVLIDFMVKNVIEIVVYVW